MADSMIFSNDCYLRDTCWKYHNKADAECKTANVYCPRLFRMNYLFDVSLMSLKQREHQYLHLDEDGSDREAFNKLKDIETNIEQFVQRGSNLYIHSTTCGNGKTAWSLRLLQSYINKVWHKSDLRCKVLFISVPRYLLTLKESISTPSEYIDHIKKNIFNADLVVFDEIGTKVATSFELENMLNLINTRIDMGKSNIYTSNLRPNELRERLGDRLYSRIAHLSTDIEFFGADKRGII